MVYNLSPNLTAVIISYFMTCVHKVSKIAHYPRKLVGRALVIARLNLWMVIKSLTQLLCLVGPPFPALHALCLALPSLLLCTYSVNTPEYFTLKNIKWENEQSRFLYIFIIRHRQVFSPFHLFLCKYNLIWVLDKFHRFPLSFSKIIMLW